jgi:flagellar hook-basal body complex protein FliE
MDVMAKVAPGLYNAAREALGIDRSAAMDPQAVVAKPVGPSFGETLAEAARQTLAGLQRAEAVSKDAVVGKADPHSVVEALAATEMALETAVTVRDRVVEAYQEILRMPV